MNTTVEVTVVNLCYNTGLYVLDTLDSIKNQTYKNLEVIVVDDGSADNSKTLLDDWINENNGLFPISFIKNEENIGICRSINKALQRAKGKYFAIIGDDCWHPGFLEELHNLLLSAPPTVCMAYAKSDVMDYRTKKKEYWLEPIKNVEVSEYPQKHVLFNKTETDDVYFVPGNLVQQCLFYSNLFIAFTGLIKMDLLKSIGGYNEAFSFEDMPMWFSLSRKYDFLYIDRYLATYVRHDDSFTVKTKAKLYKSVIDIYLYNSDLAKDENVKAYLNEILYQYWYKLYSDTGFPRKELMPYTYKLMRFSGYLFRKFSLLFAHKVKREARRKLFS